MMDVSRVDPERDERLYEDALRHLVRSLTTPTE
jgi:hypothetical protein